MTLTKTDVQRRLAELGPQALMVAREARAVITFSLQAGGKDNSAPILALRQATLRYVAHCKEEYHALHAALERGDFG